MTRKEIEERCREEMQQSIPDREALWQRIEAGLPAQQEAPRPQSIRRTSSGIKVFRSVLTAAACLLIVVAGVGVVGGRLQNAMAPAENKEQVQQEHFDGFMNEAPAEEQAGEEMKEENEGVMSNPQTEPIRYESLHFPTAQDKVHLDSIAMLSGSGQLFSEEQVLADSECLVIGTIAGGTQDPEDGQMLYFFIPEQIYGDAAIDSGETIAVRSDNPYLMQSGHRYLLGLRYEDNFWHTSCDSAPQPEFTADGQAVYHNGWQSFRQDDEQPLVCARFGAEDYFYDRMYLGDADALIRFAEEWGRL
ncbi:MAG: hypothetical protein E7511_04755 [Ruminococcus sp.]|nr:hypothetical protein [Ruminococcus sp.]